MENDGLYENLDDVDAEELKEKIETIEKRVIELETALSNSEEERKKIVTDYDCEKTSLLKNNENLLINLSTLFKTAKKEIERKDRTIKELRQHLDDISFRRYSKPWMAKRDVVLQSQNEDDAICAKPVTVTEDKNAVASVIRPNIKGSVLNDRERRSNSDDKRPLLSRQNVRNQEYVEKDRHSHSNRPAQERRSKTKDFDDFNYSNTYSDPSLNRDQHYVNNNSCNSHYYRRTERKSREEDSLRRELVNRGRKIRVDTKLRDGQRYSPYNHYEDEYDRVKHKSHRLDRGLKNEDHLKHRIKRLSAEQNRSRPEYDDDHRNAKRSFDDRRPDSEIINQKSHEDRRRKEVRKSLSKSTSKERKRDNSSSWNKDKNVNEADSDALDNFIVEVMEKNEIENDSSQSTKSSPPEVQELLVQSDKTAQNSTSRILLEIMTKCGDTPLKLLNGDKFKFPSFKLMSPIANTPDNLRAFLQSNNIKVSPIPMINERRTLDGFISPVKKPATDTNVIATKRSEDTVVTDNSASIDAKSKVESLPKPSESPVIVPSPRKSLTLSTTTMSPFKNCCLVNVRADPTENVIAEAEKKEKSTSFPAVSGIDSTDVEHRVFTRKRRAPVIRHVKKV